jgi:hypothetical protein
MRRVVALSIALAIDALAPDIGTASGNGARVFALGYGALATSLPDDGLGVGGGASLRVALTRHFLPSLGIVVMVTPHEEVGSAPSVHYDARLVAARVEGCLSFAGTRAAEAFACVGPWLGAFTTASSGLANASNTTTFWAAAVAALELHVRLTEAIRLHLGADALVSLRRTKVQVLNSEGQVAIEQKIPGIAGMVRFGPVFAF